MSAAFVPAFTRHLTLHGKPAAWRLGNSVLNALVIATVTLVVAGMVFARPLVTLYAGDYAVVPGKLELTVALTRLMLPFLTTVAVATVAMGMLNSLHHYFSCSPRRVNVATIALRAPARAGDASLGLPRIMAIAIAVLLGGLGQVLAMAGLRREGFQRAADRAARPPPRRRDAADGTGDVSGSPRRRSTSSSTRCSRRARNRSGVMAHICVPDRVPADRSVRAVPDRTALPAIPSRGAGRPCRNPTTVSRSLAIMLMLNVPATIGLLVLARPIVALRLNTGVSHRATRTRRLPRCVSTPSAWWVTRPRELPRPPFTRSGRAGSPWPQAWPRSPAT